MAQLKSTNILGNLSVTGNILASKFIKLGGTANQILMADGSTLDKSSVGSGSVTSVAMTVPTGLTVTGSPITTSGTLAVTLTSGYSIPTTAKQAHWDTAYGWGNHANAGYLTAHQDLSGYVTGSGTANYIPKFTAAGTIGNSEIIDNGTNVYPNANLGNALGHADYIWDRAYIRQIDLNRAKGTNYGRISFYSPSFVTWYEYMSNNGVASPTGANTIQYGEVTTWARRSLIENSSGYGWVWEACANSSNTTPIGKMALSSNTGNLMTAGSTKSTAFILHSSGTTKATFAYNASDDCVELTFA